MLFACEETHVFLFLSLSYLPFHPIVEFYRVHRE
ncbi:unnamed protein product [Tuber melanosporum]|uniref:(Perigord truffle) hypothetical protein n=1 Tax=Tuber melanosporum (strain Mel28) TaxID=656061 RepID=D5GLC0_TUBMM|nr:uncharacterized protein GSTUM_00010125001 [Tuber melanosporum]CAZ85313.1 unnamed protein product [Tuber melanosporum]